MSYTKQTWANGDIITAEKLNRMESGIEAAGYDLVIQVDIDEEGEIPTAENCSVIVGSTASAISNFYSGEPVKTAFFVRDYEGEYLVYSVFVDASINASEEGTASVQADYISTTNDGANIVDFIARKYEATISDSGVTYFEYSFGAFTTPE